jgi:hypothetical protein
MVQIDNLLSNPARDCAFLDSMGDSASSTIIHDTSTTRAQPHLHFDYAVDGFVGSINWACAHANAY